MCKKLIPSSNCEILIWLVFHNLTKTLIIAIGASSITLLPSLLGHVKPALIDIFALYMEIAMIGIPKITIWFLVKT